MNVGKQTFGLDPSYATSNKWWISIPMKTVLGDAYPNLEMQVQQFYLPGIEVGTATTSFKGYSVKYPQSKILNAGDKILKFRYIIDDNWYNYSSLYTWAAKLGVLNNPSESNYTTQILANAKDTNKYATVRLYLLSPFKKSIVTFIFKECWIQNFGELLMDVQNSNPITHDMTFSYNVFNIDRPSLLVNNQEKED